MAAMLVFGLVHCVVAQPPPAPATFPGSELVAPAQGAQLNSWANQPDGTAWELCYTTFTMDKTTAEFHSRCDSFAPTMTVARNAGAGNNPGNYTFGGFVRLLPPRGTQLAIRLPRLLAGVGGASYRRRRRPGHGVRRRPRTPWHVRSGQQLRRPAQPDLWR